MLSDHIMVKQKVTKQITRRDGSNSLTIPTSVATHIHPLYTMQIVATIATGPVPNHLIILLLASSWQAKPAS